MTVNVYAKEAKRYVRLNTININRLLSSSLEHANGQVGDSTVSAAGCTITDLLGALRLSVDWHCCCALEGTVAALLSRPPAKALRNHGRQGPREFFQCHCRQTRPGRRRGAQ